jgi:hypothetical protein
MTAFMPGSRNGSRKQASVGRPSQVADMERNFVKIWYDPEGDFLEVIFDRREGYFRETANDQVMEKVDAEGNVLGFSVLAVSSLKQKPLDVSLT